MKKMLIAIATVSVFALSSAAYACDGMKGHTKDTQAEKKDSKDGAKKQPAGGTQTETKS